MLVAAARQGPAFVVPTAAARQGPERAVALAKTWFAELGLDLEELPVLKRSDANSKDIAGRARAGGFFYLVGGDPGLVVSVLLDSRVWRAIFEAWCDGAALAGSSAGSMALCSHTLIRATWPTHFTRRPLEALAVVPDTAVLPHYERFGFRWVESAKRELPGVTLLGLDERTAAVWSEGEWTAAGAREVLILKDGRSATFRSGKKIIGLPDPVRMLPGQ